MKRRTLLAAVSMGTATVAGCVGEPNRTGDENAEPKYEDCNMRVLHYRILPEDVKTEVDTAFHGGQYESNEELLWQQVAGPRVEVLGRDGSYYAPQVDVDNGVYTLQFEEITPQYDSTKYLTVSEVPEVPLDISITITDAQGTVLEEIDLTIEERHSDQKVPVASEFGTYIMEITVEDWGSVTEELTLASAPEPILLNIRDDDEAKSSFSVQIRSISDQGAFACPWEQR
ncbi:hypothetical protein [Natrinema hispanicum]|nr:hypothetical protein [Natrinema hispanicum]